MTGKLSSPGLKTRLPPDVFVFLDVYLVELALHRGHDVRLHLYGHVLGEDGEEEPLLEIGESEVRRNECVIATLSYQ